MDVYITCLCMLHIFYLITFFGIPLVSLDPTGVTGVLLLPFD